MELTDLDSVPAEPEPREHHLAQSKSRSESGEVADGNNTDEIEEEANETCVGESEEEQLLCEKTNGEGGNDHVGGKPLRAMSGVCL